MAITNEYIDATITTVYTSTDTNAITSMIFCNYATASNIAGDATLTDADTYLDLHIVPSGDTYNDKNKILHQLKLPAGETFIMDTERLVLENGDTIQAQTTSPATISVTVSSIPV